MAKTKYFWDPVEDNVTKEYDENGSTIVRYTTEPDLYGNLISQERDGVASYYHFDGQGSTLALTNKDGDITDEYAYDAFGETTKRDELTDNKRLYVGEKGYQYESETHDYYARSRTYAPTISRWLSIDPAWLVAPLSRASVSSFHTSSLMTPFSYVDNRPTMRIDPSGLVGQAVCEPTPFRGVNNIFTRGRFFASLQDASDDSEVATEATLKFSWDPDYFITATGCCCCNRIGFIQIARGFEQTVGFGVPTESYTSWHLDTGRWFSWSRTIDTLTYAFADPNSDTPALNDPCDTRTEATTAIKIGDMPGAAYTNFFGTRRRSIVFQEFETCAVCIAGRGRFPESPTYQIGLSHDEKLLGRGMRYLTGMTVYGCIHWGHAIIIHSDGTYFHRGFLSGSSDWHLGSGSPPFPLVRKDEIVYITSPVGVAASGDWWGQLYLREVHPELRE